jgi:hypothetical protein
MNSSALLSKAIRSTVAIAARRTVSDLRIQTKSVVYKGKTYTRMVYPHTITAEQILYPWKYEFKTSWMMRYSVYAFIALYPLWVMVHNAGKHHLLTFKSTWI